MSSLSKCAIVIAIGAMVGVGCTDEDASSISTVEGPTIGLPLPTLPVPVPLPPLPPPSPSPPSCAGQCDATGMPVSASGDPCSCAPDCTVDGTCCADYEATCEPIAYSCFGACGGAAVGGCWCDAACSRYGDCCGDEMVACEDWPLPAISSTVPATRRSMVRPTAVATYGSSVVVVGVFQGSVDLGGVVLEQTPGDRTQDIFVASYLDNGQLAWAKAIGGPMQQWPHDVAIDGQGVIYIAGQFYGTSDFGDGDRVSAGSADGFLLSMSGSGRFNWVQTVGGSGYDELDSVIVGDRRQPVVSGRAWGPIVVGNLPLSSSGYTSFVASFGVNGSVRWLHKNDAGDATVRAPLIALGHRREDVYVATNFAGTVTIDGTAFDSRGERGVLVERYDEAGAVAAPPFTVDGTGDEFATGIAIDAWGNVAMVGHFTGELREGSHHAVATAEDQTFIASVDSSGRGRWVRLLRGIDLFEASSSRNLLAIDAASNIWLGFHFGRAATVGGVWMTPNNSDAAIASFTTDGTLRFQRHLIGASSAFASAVATDDHNRGYMVGIFYGGTLSAGTTVLRGPAGASMYVIRAPE